MMMKLTSMVLALCVALVQGKDCSFGCTQEIRPVFCDGKRFNNKCMLNLDLCKSGKTFEEACTAPAAEVPAAEPVVRTNKCATFCPQVMRPVFCGGKKFNNKCMLNVELCQSGKTFEEACAAPKATEPTAEPANKCATVCPQVMRPVFCGGKKFNNKCMLNVELCKSGKTFEEACAAPKTAEPAAEPAAKECNFSCTMGFKPVFCGGKRYSNECSARLAFCKRGEEFVGCSAANAKESTEKDEASAAFKTAGGLVALTAVMSTLMAM